jgi:hypothetical protein
MKKAAWHLLFAVVALMAMSISLAPAFAATSQGVAADPDDPRAFSQTGYRIDNDKFWDYFQHRGGINNFGYPVSRTFQLLGHQVQIFQRRVLEIEPDGSVGQLNLLDNSLMPYTTINGATFPATDPNLIKTAPAVGSPNYSSAIINWIEQTSPNTLYGMPVNFFKTFYNTVSLSVAYPNGGGDPNSIPGLDLEMWGVPLSPPTSDPHNSNFVYQRFQRGIMMYDNSCKCTQGVLLGDYFKSIITGNNLPADLATQAAASPFFKQYNNANPNGLNNPDALPNTNMKDAFVTEVGAPSAAPTSVPTAAPTPVPTAVPTSVPTVAPTRVPTPVPTTVPTVAAPPTPTPANQGPLLAAAAGLGLVAFIGIVVGVVMLSSRRPPAPQAPPAPSPAPPSLPPRSDATEVIDRTEVMDRTVVSAPVDDGATLIAGPGRQPPSLPKGKLHIVQLGTESEVILSQSETVLGREASNPVVLKDPLASRRHARIILENGDYWIEDLKSLNGTRVNGEVLSERRKLASNDQIKIGDIVLTFMLESGK